LTVPSPLKLVQLVRATNKITQSSNSETLVWPLNVEVFFLCNCTNWKSMKPDLCHSQTTDTVFFGGSNKTDLIHCYSSDKNRHDK
jgi:hypothetical protein